MSNTAKKLAFYVELLYYYILIAAVVVVAATVAVAAAAITNTVNAVSARSVKKVVTIAIPTANPTLT